MISVLMRGEIKLLFSVSSPLPCLIFPGIYLVDFLAAASLKEITITLIINYDTFIFFRVIVFYVTLLRKQDLHSLCQNV